MKQTSPPRLATWMLENLTLGRSNDALAGDLLEEFRYGRSTAWYWRQALTAIAIGCIKNIARHRVALLFAALWSMLAPAWTLYITKTVMRTDLIGRMWSLEWPWSTICYFLSSVIVCLIFIWAGALLYLIPHIAITKNLNIRRLMQGWMLSLPILVITGTAMITLKFFLPHTHFMDIRVVTPMHEISNLSLRAMVSRLPFFLTLLCMLWEATPRSKNKLAA